MTESKNSQSDIYKYHHSTNRERGFSILKDERGRLLEDLIGEGKAVLDIGCRDGALTKYFVPGNTVLGVDIDDVALAEAAKLGIETKKVDLNGDWSELSGRKFDVVVAGEVLEHLYYPDQVSKKAAMLLNPGGLFVGSVPNAFSLKNRLRYLMGTKRYTPLSDPTHINHFHADELKKLLQKSFSKVE
ncbi:MAG: class I SAM-dependent methyltransferase, partial [Patescibacteria group bacterium]